MSDYISREAAKEAFRKWTVDGDKLGGVLQVVDSIPAADVAPVRHGRWEIDDEGFVRCGVCHQKNPLYNAEFVELTPYCPNCGASMLDGEAET